MSEEKALAVVEQREVDFYGDDIIAALVEEEGRRVVYVPIRPVCNQLGIDWSSQRQRINRDPVLSKTTKGVVVITTPSADGRGGGPQEMLCISLDYLNGWLFGINANRVKPEIRERLIRYQTECYRILADAFREGSLTTDGTFSDLLKSDSPAAQAYRMAQAIMSMARQQLILESRVNDHEQRLETIESTLGDPDRYLSTAQASRISQAVKAIALELGKRTGRNEFGGVYGELYRRFEIAGYRELPAARYDEAMGFLRQWYSSLTDDDVPF
jgi:hypothetical protein